MRRERLGGFDLAVPETRRERARGLLGVAGLGPREGLLLRRCRSVHTFGMRFPVDVVPLDGRDRPLGVRTLAPRRLLLPRPGVRHVVEVPAGRGRVLSRALGGRTTPGARGTGRRGRT